MDKNTYKIALYADDISFLFVQSPDTSLPAMLEIIQHFSCFSGYSINLEKSVTMLLGSNRDIVSLKKNPIKAISQLSFVSGH